MERFVELLKQYRYGILILLLGIGLMLLPTAEDPAAPTAEAPSVSSPDMNVALEEILGKIDGVGKVSVYLTEAAGEITLYQTDTDLAGDRHQEDTVLITDENRCENGLVKQILPPTYQGAIIVCQGGDRPSVKLAVVEAVAAVTGLTSDRITVLKMK